VSSKGRITYNRKTGRFRDAAGRFISKSRALKSSTARAEYLKATTPRPRRKAPAAAPTPRPGRVAAPVAVSRPHITYDARSGRFRDAKGHFIPKARALKSSIARAQYQAAIAPPKPKTKPKRPRKPKAPPVPLIFEVAAAPGQMVVENARLFTIEQLARMILLQIESGAFRFRFWYKLPEISVDYPLGVGSTPPMLKNVITKNDRYSEIVSFLRGRQGWIKGKVTTYWFSNRRMRYKAAPDEVDAYK